MSAPVVGDGDGPAGMDILKASAQVGAGTGKSIITPKATEWYRHYISKK